MEAEKVSDNNFKQYQISINGNQFEISSPYGEVHIREVERFLDGTAKEYCPLNRRHSTEDLRNK